MQDKIIQKARELLSGGEVKVVIGYGRERETGSTPCSYRSPKTRERW